MKRLLALGFLGAIFLSALAPASKANAIINGETANEYSWSVAFIQDDAGRGLPVEERIICSGALVASQWVLTAAHCKLPRETTWVVIGRNDLRQGDGEKRRLPATGKAHYRYEGYVEGENEAGDAMLVKLDQPSTKSPIGVSGRGLSQYWGVGTDVRLYGYGATSLSNAAAGLYSRYLRRAEFVVTELNSNHLQMEAAWAGRSGCKADSGGPFVVSTPYGPRIVGVFRGTYLDLPACSQAQIITKVGWRSSSSNSPVYDWIERTLIELPEY